MQSKVSFASRYRVPAAGRCSVLKSPIPDRLPLGPSTKRWATLLRAVEESIVTDGGVSIEVTQTSNAEEPLQVSLDKEGDGLAPLLASDVKVYDVLDAVVVSAKPKLGVFANIGTGADALLHITEVSSEKVGREDFKKMFTEGGKIKVMVLRIAKSGNVALSTKSLELNPGDMTRDPRLVYEKAEEGAAAYRAQAEANKLELAALRAKAHVLDPNLKVHEVRSGVVRSVRKFGVLVDIGAGPFGLLHESEISSEPISEETIVKMFRVGDKIKAMVHSIDYDAVRFNLSTKNLEVTPGDMTRDPKLVYEKAEETAAAFMARAE